MAWLWHSVFKRRESWDRKEIQTVIIQSRFENFLAMEFFLQMKSPGAPVFKRREEDSSSLSRLRAPVLSSLFLLKDSSRQHRGAGVAEWWAHSWDRRTPTCYHPANPQGQGNLCRINTCLTLIHWAVALSLALSVRFTHTAQDWKQRPSLSENY